MHRFELNPNSLEKIHAVRFKSSWKPSFTTKITTNREAAIVEVAQDEPDLKIFTDSSGMKGGIGTSAILYRNNTKTSALHSKLGSSSQHMVYEDKAIGMLLTAHLICREVNV